MVDSGRLDAFASDTSQYTADLCLGSPFLLPVRREKLSEESTDVGSKSKYTLSLTLITPPMGCKEGGFGASDGLQGGVEIWTSVDTYKGGWILIANHVQGGLIQCVRRATGGGGKPCDLMRRHQPRPYTLWP